MTTHAWLSMPKLVSCQSTFAEGAGAVAFVNGDAPAGALGDTTALVGALPKGDVLAVPCAGVAKGEVVVP